MVADEAGFAPLADGTDRAVGLFPGQFLGRAMIGRKATWMRGTSVRPAALAAAITASICSAVLSKGSPHRQ